jgi:diguanylate cyclase (GGDEF)-like protein
LLSLTNPNQKRENNMMPAPDIKNRRILIIDDDQYIRKMLADILADEYECAIASSAEEALDVLRTSEFSLVVSDINMKGISGLELVPEILALAPYTVVIMMSGAQAIDSAVASMRVGAFDYLTKPFDTGHVEAAVRRAMEHYELRIMTRDYGVRLERKVEERTAALRETTERLQAEITERNRVEERLNYLAYYDLLTDLPNRALFKDRLAQALNVAQRDKSVLAVVLVSLDQLKSVGDNLSATIADELICQGAERFKLTIREGDTLSYCGGDEFGFLFTQLETANTALEITRRIQSTLQGAFCVDSHDIYLTPSMGVVVSPMNGSDADTLMKNASAALVQAKERGGNGHEFYTAGMNAKAVNRLSLESNLRRALDRDEFIIHYQPKIDINGWRIAGAEALVRWQHPEKGLVPPSEFIPLAEETGLIVPIDDWVLRTAFTQLKRWLHPQSQPFCLSTNVSARQFQHPDFFKSTTSIVQQVGLDPCHLELELTESCIMTRPEAAIRALKDLKDIGITISVDDFGTGFSSLGYLKRLPIDILKIDKSFVNDVTTDPDDAALVMAIITLAHNLKLKVVAEGVETEEQLRFLRLLRCDQIQGYFFSKPVSSEAFTTMLAQDYSLIKDWNSLRSALRIDVEGPPVSAAA